MVRRRSDGAAVTPSPHGAVLPVISHLMIVTRRRTSRDRSTSLVRDVRDPRAGILGPDSIAWRVGGDLAVFLGGGRAALLQLAHPMVAYAIDHHSKTRADVLGRFQRTFRNVFAMVFGELDDALTSLRVACIRSTRACTARSRRRSGGGAQARAITRTMQTRSAGSTRPWSTRRSTLRDAARARRSRAAISIATRSR